ncbi:hypothetical protein Trydic_g19786 [Trypoxylus dichotomus]
MGLGFITHYDNEYPVFVHRTFAEFFVAKWLIKNIGCGDATYIYRLMLDTNQAFLLNIHSEAFPLHKAIIDRDFETIERLCSENLDYALEVKLKLIELMLQSGAHANCMNLFDLTCLIEAVLTRNKEVSWSARGIHGNNIRDLLGVGAAGGTAMSFCLGEEGRWELFATSWGHPVAWQCGELLFGRGKDCAVWLVRELQSLAEDVSTAYKCPISMDKLTPGQYRQYATSPTCHICEKPLGAERVRDHCHFTGKYRGAAHSQCNLEYRDTKTIPAVFHNLSGYDGHLLVEELAKSGKLRVIPNNTEWCIAMTHTTEDNEIKFKFIDSFRSNFNRDVGLLKRKGVFPYGYVDDLKKLDEQHLPPIAAIHSDLTNTNICEDDYEHTQKNYGLDAAHCKVSYMDTDSLIYAIEMVDVYEDMKTNITRFDTSDYLQNNIYGIHRVNKKVSGLMKNEGAGKLLLEFVGLRAKMYACRFQDCNIKKAKGVKTYVVKQEITFDDYLRCLERDSEMVRDQRDIRSFYHQLYTTVQTKTSLSPYDNKRFRVPGFTDTLLWGHYSVPVNPHHEFHHY